MMKCFFVFFQSTVCSSECFGATGMESSGTFTSSAGVPHPSFNSQIQECEGSDREVGSTFHFCHVLYLSPVV